MRVLNVVKAGDDPGWERKVITALNAGHIPNASLRIERDTDYATALGAKLMEHEAMRRNPFTHLLILECLDLFPQSEMAEFPGLVIVYIVTEVPGVKRPGVFYIAKGTWRLHRNSLRADLAQWAA